MGPPGDSLPRRRVPSKGLSTRKGGGGRARAGASRPCLVPVACVGTAGRLVSAGLFFCPTSTRGIVRWRESPRRGQSPVPCARRLRRDGRPTGLGRAFFFAKLSLLVCWVSAAALGSGGGAPPRQVACSVVPSRVRAGLALGGGAPQPDRATGGFSGQ